jgi:DNA-binding NarL/FixJ family response regulator
VRRSLLARSATDRRKNRFAVLAAAGKKNREISAEMFISRRTVEANLARVYRKLDVNSRAELGVRLGRAARVELDNASNV